MTRSLTLLLAASALVLPALALAQQGNGQGKNGAGMPGQHFIENWDEDGDGQVTLAEALQKRDDLFYMFDSNEDDILDAAEYDTFDETRNIDIETNAKGMKPADVGMAREFADTDGNGEVTKEEFLAITESWFVQMDRNGDGVLTTNDFGRRGG